MVQKDIESMDKLQAESEAIQEITDIVTSSLDLSQVSASFFSALKRLVNGDVAVIYTIDESAEVVNVALVASTIPILRQTGDSWPLAGSAVEHRLKAGASRRVGTPLQHGYIQNDLSREAAAFPSSNEYLKAGIRSIIWAPISHKGRTIGLIKLGRKKLSAFNQADLARLERLASRIAPAVEAAALYQETLRQKQFAQALNRVSKSLNSTLDSQQVLDRICQECCQLSRFLGTRVALWEIEGEEIVCRAAWPPPTPPVSPLTKGGISAVGDRLPLKPPAESGHPAAAENLALQRVARSGQSEIVNGPQRLAASGGGGLATHSSDGAPTLARTGKGKTKADADTSETTSRGIWPYTPREVQASHSTALLAVPLLEEERGIGVLVLGQDQPNKRFTNQSREMAEAFAAHAATALRNARLHEAAQQKAAEIALVDEVARVITSTLNINEVYQKFCTEMKRLVDFDRVNISIIDQDAGVFLVKYQFGPSYPGRRVGDVVPLAGTLTEQVLVSGQTLLREDIADEVRFPADRERLSAGLRSGITVPMVSQNRVIGVLSLHSRRAGAFQVREQVILERLAKQIAPAIENAYLYQQINSELAQRQQAEASLQQSETRFRGLVENSSDILWEVDSAGVYTYCSPNVTSILGYRPEEMVGKRPSDIMPSEEATRVNRLFGAILAEQRPFALLDHQVHYKDGRLGFMECSGRPVFDEDGRFTGYRGVDRDITQRKLAEADRQNLEEQLFHAQKMDSIGRLAGGIAHDFNNLLAAILGFASIMQNRLNPANECYEYAKTIESAAQRGAQLTHQLLTAARRVPFEAKPMDVSQAVLDVLKIISATISKNIHIVPQLQPGLAPVRGDIGQIQQVLMNLCINAADSMPEGGELGLSTSPVYLDEEFCHQHLSLQPGEYVQVSVADTGIGISEENQQRIFEPFFTTKAAGRGTGLGLSVAYGIVTNHGGLIQVSSELGHGSTFTIYLPVSKESEELEVDSTPAPGAGAVRIPSRHGESAPMILVVDDEDMVRRMVRVMLEGMGYRVILAADGREAIEAFRQRAVGLSTSLRAAALEASGSGPAGEVSAHGEPVKSKGSIDLVLLDLMMPGLNGLETLAELQQIDPKVKAVLSTGYPQEEVIQRALEQGVKGVMIKPYNRAKLFTEINQVLAA